MIIAFLEKIEFKSSNLLYGKSLIEKWYIMYNKPMKFNLKKSK